MCRNRCENKKNLILARCRNTFRDVLQSATLLSSCLKIAIQFARNIRFKAYFRLLLSSQTPSATVVMDPIRITSGPGPQIPVAPMIPGQIPVVMPQPYAMPQAPQVPYDISISGVAAPPPPQPPAPPPQQYFQPMPKGCEDYSQPRCRVFLDWPTGRM